MRDFCHSRCSFEWQILRGSENLDSAPWLSRSIKSSSLDAGKYWLAQHSHTYSKLATGNRIIFLVTQQLHPVLKIK